MKKIHTALCLAAALIAACGSPEKKAVSISGTIQGLGNDTLYLYGTDRLYNRLDTLYVKEDKLSGEIQIDTLTTAWLQFRNGTELPVYMDKANEIKINGTADRLEALDIRGNAANETLTRFRLSLDKAAPLSDKALEDSATAFIRNNLTSPACLYVLDKYFVRRPSPDLQAIKDLIEGMTGELKERLYIENLLSKIETAEKAQKGKIATYFQLPDAEGKNIKRTDFKDKYLLLYFWASWDEQCKESNRMLRQIYKEKKNREHFDILGISLDTDKRRWKEAIANDTLEWKQVCDFKGWNSDIIDQFAVCTLPTNILLNPAGKMEERDLTQKQLEEKLKEIAKEKTKKKK